MCVSFATFIIEVYVHVYVSFATFIIEVYVHVYVWTLLDIPGDSGCMVYTTDLVIANFLSSQPFLINHFVGVLA